jgi:uncharacterized membrane protein
MNDSKTKPKAASAGGTPRPPGSSAPFWRYILIGFFTVAPLWVTWLVFNFLIGLLASTGKPLLWGASRGVSPFSKNLAEWLINPNVQYVLAALATLLALHFIGLFTSMVVGRRLIAFMEALLNRLPLVQTIYGATKRLLTSLQQPPATGQRVALISFPNQEMKTIGFITKVIRNTAGGGELAVVYVPTAPNPTSGYIEIVPLEDVVLIDWTVEEAMTFVMTAGTTSPTEVRFRNDPLAGSPPA